MQKRQIFIFSMILLLAPLTLRAQVAGEGAIQGRIADPSGAVVPNATVTAMETSTGLKTVSKSTKAGIYSLNPLLIGNYTVTVEAPGFATAVQEHIVVNATKTVSLNFTMTVGSVSEQVVVTGAPPMLDKTDATLGAVMDNKTYESLPLLMGNGQLSPVGFITLEPGVAPLNRTGEINGAGGGAGGNTEVDIEGMPIVDDNGGDQGVQLGVSVDAVSQFQVVTSSPSVQYEGEGAVNFNFKSGTNQFHGSGLFVIRNTAFDAWNYFAKAATVTTLVNGVATTKPEPKPAEHQDQENLSLGGPVRIPHIYNGRDKLFFFVSYMHYHQSTGVNPSLVSVPTTAERGGDFSQLTYPIYDPTTTNTASCIAKPATCTVQPFNGNKIPANEISPMAQLYEKYLPAPSNENSDQGNLLSGVPGNLMNWVVDARGDWQFLPKQRLSLIMSIAKSLNACDGCGPLPVPYSSGSPEYENPHTGIVEYAYTISPHLVNDFKTGYAQYVTLGGNNDAGNPAWSAGPNGVGIGGLPAGVTTNTFPRITWSGFADVPTGFGSNGGNNISAENVYNVLDNLIWSHGRHNFTFGGLVQVTDDNSGNLSTTAPLVLGFSNAQTAGYNAQGVGETTNTGNPFASFLLGALPTTGMTVTAYSTLGARYRTIAPYAQDDWKLTPKLSLNLGLRWDLYRPYEEAHNRMSFLNRTLINPATGTPGALEWAGSGTYTCNCRTPVETHYKNFGPRLGLAYSVTPKTVIRAGFGIEYPPIVGVGNGSGATPGIAGESISNNWVSPGSDIPAFYLNNSTYFQGIGLANSSIPAYSTTPFISPIVNAGNYINTGANPNVAVGAAVNAAAVSYADPVLGGRAGYLSTYNLGVQRALTNTMILEVNYAGSESHFVSGGSRGLYTNQLPPQYETLGTILGKLPNQVDPATGETYLQETQAAFPGAALPYSNFGGTGGTIADMLTPMPQYGSIADPFNHVGNAHYDSLQVSLAQHAIHGYSYTVNYTYSKEIDDAAAFRSGYAIPAAEITDGIPRKLGQLDHSLGTADMPQMLNIFGVWDLPFGHSQSHFVNAVTGGWALSSIFTYDSGQPLAITASGTTLGSYPSYTPGYGKSPRIGGGWGKGINPLTASTHPYVDATAFTVPNQQTLLQYGNVPRVGPYHLFGPGGFNLNGDLSRTFKIREHVEFIFRVTSTNVTNAVHWSIASNVVKPATAVAGVDSLGTNTGSTFGTISGQSNSPRDWQFSGRIQF